MRVLAVDPGARRVGIALSDESATLATPLLTLASGPGLAAEIARTARASAVELVVVGLPRRLSGEEGPEAEQARELGAELQAAGLEVRMWDERLTSRMAESAMRKKGRRASTPRARQARRETTDRVAAAILLQSYLDSPRK